MTLNLYSLGSEELVTEEVLVIEEVHI